MLGEKALPTSCQLLKKVVLCLITLGIRRVLLASSPLQGFSRDLLNWLLP